jgi:uncharacterized OB-fold protein
MNYLTQDVFRKDVLAEREGIAYLVGSKCRKCGDVRFPRAVACPKCQSSGEALEAVLLSRLGEVTTATRVERAIPPFKPPYLLAYVQLPEGPRVFCQLVTKAAAAAEVIGKPCELVVEPLYEKEGRPVRGYKFQVTP